MKLDRKTFNEIVGIIAPHVASVDEQKELVSIALADAPRLQTQISYNSAARTFATLLIRKCMDYGQITTGEHAVSAVLDQVYYLVDEEQQKRIDDIQEQIQQQTKPPVSKEAAPPVEHATLPQADVGTQRKHIFISYASADRASFVENYAKQLHAAGYDVWVDNVDPSMGGIVGGEKWQQSLANALQQASLVNLIITPDSVRSKWVHAEIRRAKELDKPILPITIRALKTEEDNAASAALDIRDLHYINFTKMGHEQGLERVKTDLERLNVPRRGE